MRIVGPVIGADRLFIEVAGGGIDEVVAVIGIERKRIIVLFQKVSDDAAPYSRHLLSYRFLRECHRGQRNRRQEPGLIYPHR
ncbi:hypothetical protein D3C76_1621960 [compost metagenome]